MHYLVIHFHTNMGISNLRVATMFMLFTVLTLGLAPSLYISRQTYMLEFYTYAKLFKHKHLQSITVKLNLVHPRTSAAPRYFLFCNFNGIWTI